MNGHDLFLLTSGAAIGAQLVLLALMLTGIYDDIRTVQYQTIQGEK